MMSRKPNLLFVFTDEQAAKTMKAYGNEQMDTPHMDRLASESFLFERAYCTQPVCGPSRSSLLTGLFPHKSGVRSNNQALKADVPCLVELADFSEYTKAYIGKWHLGDEIRKQHGFDEWISIEDDFYRKYYTVEEDRMKHSSYHHFLIHNGFTPDETLEDGYDFFSRDCAADMPEPFTKAAFVGDQTVQFIERNKDKPFIAYASFLEPHMPFHGPRDGQYDPNNIPLPGNFSHEFDEKVPLRVWARQEFSKSYGVDTEEGCRQLTAKYWGLVSMVDTQIGRIMDTLAEHQLFENTIVVFTSDHGEMMGAHRLIAKKVFYEESVTVPMMIRLPNKAGRRIATPVSQIDLVPTLLEALGHSLNPAWGLHGNSLLPYLEGQGELTEDVYIEWNHEKRLASVPTLYQSLACDQDRLLASLNSSSRALVYEDWKYIESSIGEHELYHLSTDPLEMTNLYEDSTYATIVQELSARINKWKHRTDDHIMDG
jgi:arylsulfatase